MKIEIDMAAVGRSKWYEYLIRFVFGGIATAVAGIIAKRYGPEIGGLFLAFPAILPASATLIEKHEKRKKERQGKRGTLRARAIAGVDAAGAAMGSVGLLGFALIVWKWITGYSAAIVLGLAMLAWVLLAVLTWTVHETICRSLRAKRFQHDKAAGGQAWLQNR